MTSGDLGVDGEGGGQVDGDLLEAGAGHRHPRHVHHLAREGRPRHVLAVELELHHVRLGLLRREGNGVDVVPLSLGAGGHLAVVDGHLQVARPRVVRFHCGHGDKLS